MITFTQYGYVEPKSLAKRNIEKTKYFWGITWDFVEVLPYSNNRAFVYEPQEKDNKYNIKKILISYNTTVAEIYNDNSYQFFDWYSKTTQKHINTFLGTNYNKAFMLENKCKTLRG